MITTTVSAIGGPISSVVSGWLGGGGMWPWNLVPTQAGLLGSDVSWEPPSILWCVRTLVLLYYLGTFCQAMVR